MPTATSPDGTRIDFEINGDGPTVILISAGPTDRNSNGELAALLARSCRVINYDRRGRGASGDTLPYSVAREVDDLRSVAATVDDKVALFGNSGGAFLAFRAVADRMPVERIAVWEPPYVLPGSRPPVPPDYAAEQARLAADGQRGQMVELFSATAVGMPAEFLEGMKAGPFWQFLEQAAAPALVYDAQLAGDFSIDHDQFAKVACSVLVIDGNTTPWLTVAADAVSKALPDSQRRTLAGQQHNVEASALAPALANFYTQ